MQVPNRKLDEILSEVIEAEKRNFLGMKRKLDYLAGGFIDKHVLEIGAGLHLPQGGILSALVALHGAKRVFGIDIHHPCNECLSERKRLFWEIFNKSIKGLEDSPGYTNRGCVRFISRDTIWDDNEYNKLAFLQMSASDMYFKDGMFDLIISKATFEHLKKPKEALKEMKRVLKPGGYIYMSWNPFASLRMGGHDIGIPYYFPWAHLRLSEKEHILKLREVYSNKKIYQTMPIEHRPTDELAHQYAKDPESLRNSTLQDLNQIRIKEFLRIVNNLKLKILDNENIIDDGERKYLTEEIRKELIQYSEEELLMIAMEVVLQK